MKPNRSILALAACLAAMAWCVPSARANLTGAIFTSDSTCTAVNLNIYADQDAVYLNGGPGHGSAAGLNDGDYYVQVTEPGGTLLGTSGALTPIHITGGVFDQCYQLSAIVNKASDSSSPGYDAAANGEYKVWVSSVSSFDPNSSKTDNFKVLTSDPNVEFRAVLGGSKWNDLTGSGAFDIQDQNLAGWDIQITGPDGTATTTTTDAGYSFEANKPGTYTICEVAKPFWKQTGPLEGATVTGTGLAADPLANNSHCWEVTLTAEDGDAIVQGLDFFNEVSATICATKFYDADANPLNDNAAIARWKMVLSGTDNNGNPVSVTQYTEALGSTCFTDLRPGSYTVTEVAPSANWINTTAASIGVTVADAAETDISFHNLCTSGLSHGLTLGYWSNNNGQNILKSSINDPAWRTILNGCSLRNATGGSYTVPATAFSSAYSNFRTWLLGATANNMAYMLSAQLTATTLDVSYNGLTDATLLFVSKNLKTQPGANVVACLTGTPGFSTDINGNGYITIGNLRAAAKASLVANGTTIVAGAARTYQECLKDLLDQVNNNGNNGYNVPLTIVSSTPCPFTSPY